MGPPILPSPPSAKNRPFGTITISLPVSFQGESFFIQTSRATRPVDNCSQNSQSSSNHLSPITKLSKNSRPLNNGSSPARKVLENSLPLNDDLSPSWKLSQNSQPLSEDLSPIRSMRSLDTTVNDKELVLDSGRLLQNSIVVENGAKAAPFNVADCLDNDSVFSENSKPSVNHSSSIQSISSSNTTFRDKEPILSSIVLENGQKVASFNVADCSDSDRVFSRSNSGILEFSVPTKEKTKPRGKIVPARFLQESNSRLRRLPEPGSLVSSPSRSGDKPKSGLARKLSFNGNLSPGNGQIRPCSPAKGRVSPSKAVTSPMRGISLPANAPSIISFAIEVRRAKKGENRIEEAHMLRLLDSRHLQWHCVNARATASLLMQKQTAEKVLKAAWIATSQLRESVYIKRAKLQLLTQNLKLTSILKGQMAYLEEWSLMEQNHSSSLSAASEALRASTFRLPIVGGAKADIQDTKEAISSVVAVMQAMGSSICSLLSKINKTNSLLSEISKVAAQEKELLDQSRDLLSTVAAMHVTECSLRGHLIHQKKSASLMHV